MIRIAWVDKKNEKVLWKLAGGKKRRRIIDWININNKLYNNTKYWLEKKENKKIKNNRK